MSSCISRRFRRIRVTSAARAWPWGKALAVKPLGFQINEKQLRRAGLIIGRIWNGKPSRIGMRLAARLGWRARGTPQRAFPTAHLAVDQNRLASLHRRRLPKRGHSGFWERIVGLAGRIYAVSMPIVRCGFRCGRRFAA